MLIQCPSCAATYDLPESSIGNAGRKVRCAACKTTWHAEASTAAEQTPMAAGAEPARADIFKADDLRLAGLADGPAMAETLPDDQRDDQPAGESLPEIEPEPAPRSTTFSLTTDDDEIAPHLKVEATTDDDLTAATDDAPDNSQDDIDSLFGGPSVSDLSVVGAYDADEAGTTDASKEQEAVDDIAASLPPRRDRKRMSQPKAKVRRPFPLALAASFVLIAAVGASTLYRQSVVAAMPQTAHLFAMAGMPVNLRGVEIRNVSSRIMTDQGTQQLVVEGEIVNILPTEAKLSRLRFAVRSEKGQEIYSWKAPADKPALEPGESLKFRRKLASPPNGAADVVVRFETRGDMVAGVQ